MKSEKLVFTPVYEHTPRKKGQILNFTIFLFFLKKKNKSPSSFHMGQVGDVSEYFGLIH